MLLLKFILTSIYFFLIKEKKLLKLKRVIRDPSLIIELNPHF